MVQEAVMVAAMRRREEREAYLGTEGMAYADDEEPARAALLELSRRLRALEQVGFGGDAGADARLAWAFALGPLRSLKQQAEALRFADEARHRLLHRSSGHAALTVLSDLRLGSDARGDKEEVAAIAAVDALVRRKLLDVRAVRERQGAQEAADAAVEALEKLMDVLRDRAPEHLR